MTTAKSAAPSTAAKIAAGTGLVAAVLITLFGPKIGHTDTQTIAGYVVAALAAINGAIHAPAAKKAVKKVPARKPKAPKPFSMYDSIEVSTIPNRPGAVAGYVGGRWPTFPELQRRFPRAKHLAIAINAGEDAECLDIENGDATPAEAPAWCRRQHERGIARPCVYASVSQMPAVLSALKAAGIGRSMVRVWTAHYTGRPHLCGQACWHELTTVADATQYTDRALSRNLDESYCSGSFL